MIIKVKTETKNKMYSEVQTWNPFVGCKYDCVYCAKSYKWLLKRICMQQEARSGNRCNHCYNFEPHEHNERLENYIKPSKILWPCAHGDLTFATPEFIFRVIDKVKSIAHKFDEIYWQSKNPKCLEQYQNYLPQNSSVLTTLETNRDEGYNKISKAPVPSVRANDFKNLNWKSKIITIEPILKFDLLDFFKLIKGINPYQVWFGYESKNTKDLPQPTPEETNQLIEMLRANGVSVKRK